MPTARLLACFVAIWLVAVEAQALRCGTSRVDQRISYPYRLVSDRPFLVDVFEIPIVIEEWIYNFGSNRFMTLLRFENGRLTTIETLEKGF